MTDRDGDSHMRNQDDSSSPRSSRSSSMFPQESNQTPPQSQTHDDSREDTNMGDADYSQPSFTASTNAKLQSGLFITEEDAPDFAWRNRRAVEEHDRCYELMQDKEFSLEQFGDPILEMLQQQEPGHNPYAMVDGIIKQKATDKI